MGFAWVAGFWTWNGTQYTWNVDHFEAPPQPHAQWVAPRVMRRGRAWQMQPGVWR